MSADGRVLILVSSLTVTHPGGQIIDHALDLKKRGFEVSILAGGGRLVHEARRYKIDIMVKSLPKVGFLEYFLVRRLAREMRRRKIRVVHAFGGDVASLAGQIARKARCPWILELHSESSATSIQSLDSAQLYRIFVPTEDLRVKLVRGYRIPKDLLTVIKPGIEMDRVTPQVKDEFFRLPVIGSFGPFIPGSRHHVLIDAMARLRDKQQMAKLVLIGDGPERSQLWRRCEKLKIIEDVIFTHDQSSRDILFDLIDVYVDCSPQESISHDLFDAMARAIVPIACGSGKVFELVEDKVTGFIVPNDDDIDLARALDDVLVMSEIERSSLGQAARSRVATEFPISDHTDRCVRLYNECRPMTAAK